jgi:type VI secretion system protein ImpH
MNWIDDLKAEPWRFNFYEVLRRLERARPDAPKIGDSATRREEYVDLGQDPFLEFPASDLTSVQQRGDRLRIFPQFLGLSGPQGALPLTTTDESLSWLLMRDDAFARFLDLFNNRFLQLFFRAWSDARPIGQHDRPNDDRFVAFIGSFIGIGSPHLRNLDSVPDLAKLSHSGLLAPKAKSASRLRGFLMSLFKVEVDVDQFVGSWLTFDPKDLTRIGRAHARLGENILLGSSVFSVEDKIRVRIYVRDLAHHAEFLPTGASNLAEKLADAVFFYLGDELEWDVELAIPSGAIEPVRLGQSGRLGWTTWMSPDWTSKQPYRYDTRFNAVERLRQWRDRQPTQ